MNLSYFLLFILGTIFLNDAVAKPGDVETTINQIENVMRDVKTLIENPAIQKAAQAHAATKKLLQESIEMAKKILSKLLTTSEKVIEASRCIRSIKGSFLTKFEDKITTFLKCELDLLKANEAQADKWRKDLTTTLSNSVSHIQKGATTFVKCPGGTLKCAESTVSEIWTTMKSLMHTLPNEIMKPGWALSRSLAAGLYQCKSAKIKKFIAIKKELLGGLSRCYINHIEPLLKDMHLKPKSHKKPHIASPANQDSADAY